MLGPRSNSKRESAWESLLGDISLDNDDSIKSTSKTSKSAVETRRHVTAPASVVSESLDSISAPFNDLKSSESQKSSGKDQISSTKVLDIANWELDFELAVGDDTDLNLLSSKEHTIVENESPPRMLSTMIPPQPRSNLPFGSAASSDLGSVRSAKDIHSETVRYLPRMPSTSPTKSAMKRPISMPPSQSAMRPPMLTDRKTSFDVLKPPPVSQGESVSTEQPTSSHSRLSTLKSNYETNQQKSSLSAKSSIKSTERPKSKLSIKRMFDTARSSRSIVSARPVSYYDQAFVDLSHGMLQKIDIGQVLNSAAITASELIMINNNLSVLPEFIAEFKEIKSIDLRFNNLVEFPKILSNLDKIEHVNLSQNSISQLESIHLVKHLKQLILSRNQITSIPSSVSKLNALTVLDLSGNYLTDFPKELSKLSSLEILDLSGNQICEVSCDLHKMKSLKELLLSDNNINSVSKHLFSMPKIEYLDLCNNEIGSITGDWKDVRSSLKELNLSANLVIDIPASLFRLSELETLDLSRNPIQTISPSIGHLDKLKTILLSPNYLNSIMIPPLKVCLLGTESILKFLRDVLNGVADPEHSFAFGSGLAKSATVRNSEQFTVKAVDRYCVAKNSGGDLFSVTIEILDELARVKTITVEPEDKGDGSYLVTYPATKVGKYKIFVQADGCDIKGSPFEIEYEPSCVSAKRSKLAHGKKVIEIGAGDISCVILELFDEYGNRIRECPSFLSPVVSLASDLVTSNIIKGDDGTFLIEFSSSKIGKHMCDMLISDEAIEGSPFTIEVRPGMVDPNSCIISSSGTRLAEINNKTTFVIQSCDKFKNARNNFKDQFNVIIDGPDGKIVPSEIQANYQNGEYYVSYTPKMAGRYRITVLLLLENGVEEALLNVAGSPFILEVTDDREDKFIKLQNENSKLVHALAEASKKLQDTTLVDQHQVGASIFGQLDADKIVDILVSNAGLMKSCVTPFIALTLFEACRDRSNDQISVIIISLSKHLMSVKNNEDTELLYYVFSNALSIKSFWLTKCDSFTESSMYNYTLMAINELTESYYNQIVKGIQNWLSPVIVTAFLEQVDSHAEELKKPNNYKTLGRKNTVSRSKGPLENILSYLRTVLNTLTKFCIEEDIGQHLIDEVIRFIDVILFNSLLLRRNLCNRETADKSIRNLKVLDNWIRKNQPSVLVHFDHLEAAIEILYAPNLNAIYEMLQPGTDSYVSTYLNSHQVERILRNAYDPIPDDAMLSKITKELNLMRKLSTKSQHSSLGKSSIQNHEHAVQIFLDTFHVAPLSSNHNDDRHETQQDYSNNFFYPPVLKKQFKALLSNTDSSSSTA